MRPWDVPKTASGEVFNLGLGSIAGVVLQFERVEGFAAGV